MALTERDLKYLSRRQRQQGVIDRSYGDGAGGGMARVIANAKIRHYDKKYQAPSSATPVSAPAPAVTPMPTAVPSTPTSQVPPPAQEPPVSQEPPGVGGLSTSAPRARGSA
jgi:hypothetical protein